MRPKIDSAHFGVIEYAPGDVITFPCGLPAFECERQFVVLQRPATAPFVFLQSLQNRDLAFVTLPPKLIEPSYRLLMAPEDMVSLDLDPGRQPSEPDEVLSYAIVTMSESQPPTANLMAPLVVNRASGRAIQALQPWSGYSHQHPLPRIPKDGQC